MRIHRITEEKLSQQVGVIGTSQFLSNITPVSFSLFRHNNESRPVNFVHAESKETIHVLWNNVWFISPWILHITVVYPNTGADGLSGFLLSDPGRLLNISFLLRLNTVLHTFVDHFILVVWCSVSSFHSFCSFTLSSHEVSCHTLLYQKDSSAFCHLVYHFGSIWIISNSSEI